jgi:amino acid permease
MLFFLSFFYSHYVFITIFLLRASFCWIGTDGLVKIIVEQHKTIGMLGSIAIAVNSLAGPAILQLPFQYQQSGIIPTTICLVIVGILSSFCCLHMADTVSQVPGNHAYDQCIEFSDVFSIFWNKKSYVITQILFFLCATCLNVAAIVDTAEVVDSFLGFHYKTCGWNAQANTWQSWSLTSCNNNMTQVEAAHDGGGDFGDDDIAECNSEPFGDETVYGNFILSVGYVITATVFVPICLMDLKENTAWQIFGFCLLCTLSLYFCIAFALYEDLTFANVTMWGFQWSNMLGVILFNFALVMAVPSWLHEKKENVSVKKVVYGSTGIAMILYVSVGILGAFAIPNVKVNMLEPMVSGAYGIGLQITGSLFAFVIIGLDIPLFSVLCRYNLTHSGLCSNFVANILVVWIPWLGSWLFYQGDSIGELLEWGGVLLTSTLAFVLPLYISLRALVNSDQIGSIHIYGASTSRRKQVISLYVLLFVASCAVALAIGGQILADRHEREAMEATAWTPAATDINNITTTNNVDPLEKPKHKKSTPAPRAGEENPVDTASMDDEQEDPNTSPFEQDPVEVSSTIDPVVTAPEGDPADTSTPPANP